MARPAAALTSAEGSRAALTMESAQRTVIQSSVVGQSEVSGALASGEGSRAALAVEAVQARRSTHPPTDTCCIQLAHKHCCSSQP